jgi:predicted metal-dependent hydrolase
MTQPLLPGTPPVPVTLRFSARAKRLSLRVSRLDGRVTLTAPRHVSKADAMAFAAERADWVRGHLARFRPGQAVGFGSVIPVDGVLRPVIEGRGKRPRLTDAGIEVWAGSAHVGQAVQSLLKLRARAALTQASERHAATLGRPIARITLRDTRSRWGSCSAQGALMYSWRLVMAPPEVLDYVAAHEVAHLVEMNHSDRFWAVTARLCPDYARHRKWLRDHGTDLHQYRFDA